MARAWVAGDLSAIQGWHLAHNRRPPPREALPDIGVIEPGVAAGFLILTSVPLALLDGYVTNPSAPLRARSRAIDRITDALLAVAKAQGVKRVLGLCESPGIIRRSAKHGLRPIAVAVVRGDF